MTVYVSFRKMCVIPYFVIPNIYPRNICSLTKKSPHESQQKSCLFRVIPNIYLRNLCSVTKDSPQESQQKRLSFLFRGGAWSSLSHMSEYPKCLSKGIIHITRKHFIWHGKGGYFHPLVFENICSESTVWPWAI